MAAKSTLAISTDGCGRAHEAQRIDGLAVEMRFVMEMRAGRAARRAYTADDLAARDPCARFDGDAREMRVTRDQTAAMIDFDHAAIAA